MAGVVAWLGLGGNHPDSPGRLDAAIDLLRTADGVLSLEPSPRYRTPAWGDAEQPDFINAVVRIDTRLTARALLLLAQSIEQQLGRRRDPARPWGPRSIDIDVLLYGDQVIDEPGLVIPHPRLTERAFVLVPLSDMAPELEIPGHGTVQQCVAKLDADGIAPWADADTSLGTSA